MAGNDQFGRPIDLDNFLKEGLVELQREFNQSTRLLIRYLDQVYDELGHEFEAKFVSLFRSAKHSFGVRRKSK